MAATEAPKWYEAYPVARTQPAPSIQRSRLLELLKQGQVPGKDFILVDLRRTDFEVGPNSK
jgi:arsenical-resistance protein 2